jgi:hypothetical protein
MSQSPSSEGTKIGVPALVDGSPGEARRGREGQEQGGGGKGGDSEGEGEGEPKGEPEPEPGGRLEGGKGRSDGRASEHVSPWWATLTANTPREQTPTWTAGCTWDPCAPQPGGRRWGCWAPVRRWSPARPQDGR